MDPSGRIVKESEREQKDLPVYLYIKENAVEAYIVPINAQGLWGKINGYLAINKDGSTITGFTVYKHSETPGLGGEIERSWFQRNFERDKRLLTRKGNLFQYRLPAGP